MDKGLHPKIMDIHTKNSKSEIHVMLRIQGPGLLEFSYRSGHLFFSILGFFFSFEGI